MSGRPLRGRLTVLLVAFALLAGLGAARAAERTGPLGTGEPAPDIRLRDQHGRQFTLSGTLEQRAFVVVAFYPKAFTSG